MATLIGTGSLILGSPRRGVMLLALAASSGAALILLMRGEMKHSGGKRVIER